MGQDTRPEGMQPKAPGDSCVLHNRNAACVSQLINRIIKQLVSFLIQKCYIKKPFRADVDGNAHCIGCSHPLTDIFPLLLLLLILGNSKMVNPKIVRKNKLQNTYFTELDPAITIFEHQNGNAKTEMPQIAYYNETGSGYATTRAYHQPPTIQ